MSRLINRALLFNSKQIESTEVSSEMTKRGSTTTPGWLAKTLNIGDKEERDGECAKEL